ncbi:MAG: PAS domain-containing protein [Prochloraceae cyanobacterium]
MKIWQKLTTAFGVTSFLLGTIAILSIKIDAEVQFKTNETVHGIVEEAKSASDMLNSIQTIQGLNQDLLLESLINSPDNKNLKQYQLKIKLELETLKENIRAGERATLTQKEIIKDAKGTDSTHKQAKIEREEEEIEQMNRLLAEINNYQKDWQRFSEKIEENPQQLPLPLVKELSNRMNQTIFPLVKEYQQESLSEITRAELITQQITSKNISIIKNYVLFTFAITSILFVYIYRSIYSPIKHLKLATFQLRQSFTEYEPIEPKNPNDELGVLISYFNDTIETLKTKIISKSYLDNIINSISQSLIVINNQNKIEKVNANTLDILGYSESELIGESIDLILSSSNNLTIEELIKLDNISSRCFSLNLTAKGLREISFKVYFSYLFDSEGIKIGTICLAVPVNSLSLNDEIALQQSKEKAKKYS